MAVNTPRRRVVHRADRPIGVTVLVVAFGLLSATALYGGAALIAAPDASLIDAVVPVDLTRLDGTPFADYTIPGVVLFVALGIVPIVAAYGLLVRTGWAWYGAVLVSVLLLGWLAVEYALVGYFGVLQPIYALLALGMLVVTFTSSVRSYCGIGS